MTKAFGTFKQKKQIESELKYENNISTKPYILNRQIGQIQTTMQSTKRKKN